jgi:hypothetical protein
MLKSFIRLVKLRRSSAFLTCCKEVGLRGEDKIIKTPVEFQFLLEELTNIRSSHDRRREDLVIEINTRLERLN